MIAAILGALLLISQPFLNDLQTATDDFVANYERVKADWPLHGTLFQQALAQQLPPSTELYGTLTSTGGIPVLEGFLGLPKTFSRSSAGLPS